MSARAGLSLLVQTIADHRLPLEVILSRRESGCCWRSRQFLKEVRMLVVGLRLLRAKKGSFGQHVVLGFPGLSHVSESRVVFHSVPLN